MNAALGLSQLRRFSEIMLLRKHVGEIFNAKLLHLPQIKVPLPYLLSDHFYQMYALLLSDNKMRDALQEHLSREGVLTKVYYHPVHLKTLYRKKYGYKEGDLPKTEALSQRVLTLPIYPGMSTEEIESIITLVNIFFVR